MASRFVRKVRTASGAVGVQVVDQVGRSIVGIGHIGSANTDEDLAVLVMAAKQRLMPGQQAFELDGLEQAPMTMGDVANWTAVKELLVDDPTRGRPRSTSHASAKVIASPATGLWEALTTAYSRLGFDVPDD